MSPTCCQSQGFDDKNTHSSRGLALLFDPIVDAFIFANYRHLGSVRSKNTTIIILTDYGAIFDMDVNLRLPGNPKGKTNDWAARETSTVFNSCKKHNWRGRNKLEWHRDRTTENLMNCICGQQSWRTISIAKQGVWVWNLVPFLRGGSSSSGMASLPSIHSAVWVQHCLQWLRSFIGLVQPSQIVWCTSEDVRNIALGTNFLPINQYSTLPPVGPPGLPGLVLNHPCSWSNPKNQSNCSALSRFI